MKRINIHVVVSCLLLGSLNLSAKENIGTPDGNRQSQGNRMSAAGCTPSEGKTDLDVNNVRARIMTGGDMWWNLDDQAMYEVPKNSGKMALFSGSLWIGGVDAGGQLKVAGMTYRQTGNDFWPGPLNTVDASIDPATCREYDKFWKISQDEVNKFYSNFNAEPDAKDPNYSTPASILDWPGNGNTALGQSQFLAPFFDNNNDLVYNPADGDFPYYDVFGTGCDGTDKIYGDQTLWWVFNDKGNIHSETEGQPIGLEIHAQAFGFSTNDEINDMTFYKYKIINRSTFTMNETYFGMWVDPDLGDAFDDYIGCDVQRGLGFCYNGDPQDGDGNGISYGTNPPAVGIDFFQGPLADPDFVDNPASQTFNGTGYGDSLIDNERLGMEKFMYYVNDFSVRGNPENAAHFYNYLRALWKDGTPLQFGGSGHQSGGPVTDFAFPWDTDPNNPTVWEQTAAADNRFIHSAGPFTLQPGAVNYVTIGAVWARTSSGDPKNSVELMRSADEKAQRLFDNCFQVLDGPDAPDVAIQELDRELILTLTNSKTSNNYLEQYDGYDPLITTPAAVAATGNFYDSTYNFQGYQIFQIKDATVNSGDVYNPDKARLVAQVDIRDSIARLVNFPFNKALGGTVPQEMVNGADKGIKHSFRITEDMFAQGDKRLVNHKTYYYMAIAYAYNQFKPYAQDIAPQPSNPFFAASDGQTIPYFAGRKNIRQTAGTPHIPVVESGGLIANSVYGQTPKMKKIEGSGNGGFILDFTPETTAEIIANGISNEPVYQNSKSPVEIKVVDPLNIPAADFQFELLDSILNPDVPTNVNTYDQVKDVANAYWKLTNLTSNETVMSDKTIAIQNEQIIAKWGLSVTIGQVDNPGTANSDEGGVLASTQAFAVETKPWIGFVPDIDGFGPYNWIKSGVTVDDPNTPDNEGDMPGDDNQYYEKVLGGTWGPYKMASNLAAGPAWDKYQPNMTLATLASVDIVLTKDKTKWTRCPVIEMQDNAALAEGNAKKMSLRKGKSRDINGNEEATGTGMGWFPGYAINVETGERLNMAFGEDSWLVADNGRDMIWNPTGKVSSESSPLDVVFGGKHYIYVFGHNGDARYSPTDANMPDKLRDIPKYDEGKTIYDLLTAYETSGSVNTYKRDVYDDAMWVAMPIRDTRYELLDNDLTIRLRVSKPYKRMPAANATVITAGNGVLTVGNTYYVQVGIVRHNNKDYPTGSTFVAANADYAPKTAGTYVAVVASPNYGNMKLTFDTKDMATEKNMLETAKNALELINVVPNPYYAYSGYEQSLVDNRIKITNLPQKCTISIYTVSGTLIRRFKKDEEKTSVDWDLKNTAGIPIASGLYIIHVNADGIGEKVIKWFGVMREVSLDTF